MNVKIRVLHVRAGEDAEVVEIDTSLRSMQRLVGGLLDVIQLPDGIDLWVNDEALCQDVPPPLNFLIMGNPIFGDVFLARHDGDGETVSLNDRDIARLSEIFSGRATRRAHAS